MGVFSRVLQYMFWATQVPNLVVLVILEYQIWSFWSYSGSERGCSGHTRAPNLVDLVILGYQTWLIWLYSGAKPG